MSGVHAAASGRRLSGSTVTIQVHVFVNAIFEHWL